MIATGAPLFLMRARIWPSVCCYVYSTDSQQTDRQKSHTNPGFPNLTGLDSGPSPYAPYALDVTSLVRSIHAAHGKLCVVVTGAGTQALAWLFAESGTSRTVLNARIPYSQAALDEFTGTKADQHVSAVEAMLMAERALEEAKRLSTDDVLLAGVGCTAAIATDRVRRGENRCHVAFAASDGRRASFSLVMNKGARSRAGEEDLTSRIVLNAVAEAKLVDERVAVPLVQGEKLERSEGSPDMVSK